LRLPVLLLLSGQLDLFRLLLQYLQSHLLRQFRLLVQSIQYRQ
jgi:hypothetical protein